MHIHEIIIDGFKSYATRTVVSGFDPQFNAITGLNGSGKSNILDSICFVLGISNLSQVRVGNLQELVYKQGQAGVTKASVTIVFDNSDPAGSPVGYETHKEITVTRQVVIGGKNKYMINGHTVQQTQVQNLFHSVQLNVNNPHFLIMQGRITKVLNMKPPEILSMIEEAAGTRMFETKKQAALKTIEKKQQKVEEITRVIESDIEPKLLQLRNEQKSYQEWSSTNTELERLERLCVAAEYKQAEEKVLNSEGHQETMRADMARMQEQHDTLVAEADQCQATIDELEARRESEQSGEFQLLKKREQELSKEVVKANSSHTNQKKSLQSENELLTSLEKQVHTAESGIVEKEAELAEAEVEVGTKTEEVALAEKEAVSLRTKYQNACAGVTDEADAQLLSLPEQVGVWETRSREAQSKLQQETMRNQHSMDRLKELKKQCKGEQSAHGTELRQVDALKAVVDSMQKNLQKMTYSDEEETSLRAACRALQGEVEQMQDEFETASAKVEARLNFEFRDPERGFDRSRVKGLVAKLVRIQDKIHATALEVAAGGKLFQVVVDNEQTGKLLLGKNVLQKRVTILPLNKISSRTIDPRKLNLSREVARAHGGSAHLALELVGYSEEVTRAMQYVFGNTIICDTSAVAQAIAFDKNIQCRTITLDGDTYDPAGTATGGSKNQIGSLLSRIGELGDLQAALDSCKENLKSKQKQLAAVESTGSSFRDLSEKLEMKLHELAMAEDRLSGSSYAQIAAEVAALEKDVSHFDEDVAKPLKEVHQNAQAELKKLKDTANGIKKQREQAMKNMEAATKEAQKKLTVIKSEAASVKAHRDALAAEVEGLKTELKALNEQYLICEGALKRLSAEVDALEQEVALRREEYEAAKAAVFDMNKTLQGYSREAKALAATRDVKNKEAQNISLESRKVSHQLNEWKKEIQTAHKTVANLEKKHPWIATEKAFFGLPNSDYDFGTVDLPECFARCTLLKGNQEKLSKKINKKVVGMLDKAEAEHEDLKRKKDVILNDKAKIEAVISELDVKKVQALQTTWVKVNKDFGSIFSTLLPGTAAKLDIIEGFTVMDGLEVKVAFNGVWKESLTELSGGQRSLLALSLILALLLFKPAPMYILDEVDAALDLSHTQNIGLMLRTHFSASQFIVVSLKEGMFNNANVIFRTRFVDGVSTVMRTVVGGKSKTTQPLALTDGNEESTKSKKVGKSRRQADGAENDSMAQST